MCVRPILVQAQKDLANVETNGSALGAANGWWFHPVKRAVLLPVLDRADAALQPVADVHSGTELAVEAALGTLFGACRWIHHAASTTEAVLVSAIAETAEKDDDAQEDPREREARIEMYREVQEKPFFSIDKFLEWKRAIDKLIKFLKKEGIVDEMGSIADENLLSNTTVLQRAQETWDFREAAASNVASVRSVPGRDTARKYMKFATAAYGITMMYLPGVLRALEGPTSNILSLLEAAAEGVRETTGAIVRCFPRTVRALLGISSDEPAAAKMEISASPTRIHAVAGLAPSYMAEYLQNELQTKHYGAADDQSADSVPRRFLRELVRAAFSVADAVAAFEIWLVRKTVSIVTFPIVWPIRSATEVVVHVAEKIAVSYYINIPLKDFVKFDVSPGGSMKVLRHYVVIDRDERAIVLVVRGTLSVSGLVTDLTANSVDFCGGQAHDGIQKMTTDLYEEVKCQLEKIFQEEQFRDYKLIITGHSLGAGVSCLTTLKLHHDFYESGASSSVLSPYSPSNPRKILCYAYASPAVYLSNERIQDGNGMLTKSGPQLRNTKDGTAAPIKDAFLCTTNYIHNNDFVPSLSVDAARRLFASMSAVNRELSYMSDTHDPQLVKKVRSAIAGTYKSHVHSDPYEHGLKPVRNAPRLVIPATNIVWMRPRSCANSFDYRICDPYLYADGGILLAEAAMLTNHFPSEYQHALDNLGKDENR